MSDPFSTAETLFVESKDVQFSSIGDLKGISSPPPYNPESLLPSSSAPYPFDSIEPGASSSVSISFKKSEKKDPSLPKFVATPFPPQVTFGTGPGDLPPISATHGSRQDLRWRTENISWRPLIVENRLTLIPESCIMQVFHNPQGYSNIPALAVRARQKKVEGYRWNVGGIDGEHGHSGHPGIDGGSGSHGGGHGQHGTRGGDGTAGTNGTDAHDETVSLTGQPQSLTVRGRSKQDTIDLGPKGIVMIYAKGGNGGWGGNGGHGGRGGRGGDGYAGAAGRDGHDAHGHGQRGEDGGRGGDGGPGGDGGHGGDGGQASNGGNGASGSSVTIQTSDPSLLMLAEVDARRGEGGAGGLGGHPGSGGSGGHGGPGGRGGRGGKGGPAQYEKRHENGSTYTRQVTQAGSNGHPGPSGHQGPNGKMGHSGHSGQDGYEGRDGQEGAVIYRILNEAGEIIQQSTDRFNVAILRYNIFDENNDGIFEPGQSISIGNIVIQNNGGLTLPSGSILYTPDTQSALSSRETLMLPELLPNEILEINDLRLTLTLPPIPSIPIDKHYVSSATIYPSVSLLNRDFNESQPMGTIPVQFPVKITKVECPALLGPGHSGVVRYTIENISTRPYGGGVGGKVLETELTWGEVGVHIRLDPVMNIIPMEKSYLQLSPTEALAEIPIIPPGHSYTIEFHIWMTPSSGDLLYETIPFISDLLLRRKVIQSQTSKLRIVPTFDPTRKAQCILVTCPAMNRKEFLAWSYLIQLLELSMSLWDVERYGGLSKNSEIHWLKRTDLLILPRIQFGSNHSGPIVGIDGKEIKQFNNPGITAQGSVDLLTLNREDFITHLISDINDPTLIPSIRPSIRILDQEAQLEFKRAQDQSTNNYQGPPPGSIALDIKSLPSPSAPSSPDVGHGIGSWGEVKLDSKLENKLLEKNISSSKLSRSGRNSGREINIERKHTSAVLFGWQRKELDNLLFDYRDGKDSNVIEQKGEAYSSWYIWLCLHDDIAVRAHAMEKARDLVNTLQKRDTLHQYQAHPTIRLQRNLFSCEYGSVKIFKSVIPRRAHFVSAPSVQFLTDGAVPFEVKIGSDKRVNYIRKELPIPISAPFSKALIALLLALPPKRQLQYLQSGSYISKLKFNWKPHHDNNDCCGLLCWGDSNQPRVREFILSFYDIVHASLTNLINRQFQLYFPQTPEQEQKSPEDLKLWMNLATEITEAVEESPLEFYEMELVPRILSSFQKQIDNTYWSSFSCCTRTARRRQYLIQCQERINAAIKASEMAESRLHPLSLRAAPDLQDLLRDEICFPAFTHDSMPVRVRV